MAWILLKPSNYKQVAPLVRTGGSRHTGLAALPHRNIQSWFDLFREHTYADACLARITDKRHSYRLEMNGISMREAEK